MSSDRYMAYSPSPSPHIACLQSTATATAFIEQEKYISELLSERNKLSPFVPVLPNCYRLLNQGGGGGGGGSGGGGGGRGEQLMIGKVFTLQHTKMFSCSSHCPASGTGYFGLQGNGVARFLGHGNIVCKHAVGERICLDQSGLEHSMFSNGGANRWTSPLQSEMSALSAQSWLGSQGSSSGLVVKRTMSVDIPVATYPNFNFVGRLLGPRGNSLKRVEAGTDCHFLIRGRGSIKDPAKEEMMRGKPGFEHLNEPLHILVEAELPVDIIDARLMQACEILEDLLRAVDEMHDFYKKQQLRELAMLNGTLRDETVQMSGSVSPF